MICELRSIDSENCFRSKSFTILTNLLEKINIIRQIESLILFSHNFVQFLSEFNHYNEGFVEISLKIYEILLNKTESEIDIRKVISILFLS